MQISIASFSFHGLKNAGLMDIFGYLESVKYRYQLTQADIWNGLLGNDPDLYLEPAFLKKVKDALDQRDLQLANMHFDGCHVWEDDPAARERHYKLALRYLDAAEALGARTVRIDTGGRGQTWTEAEFDLIVQRFREFARRAQNAGYRVGPETHWGAELGADNMVNLAKAVDNPAFGVLLHLGHFENSTPEEGDRKVAPYACHTHIDAATTRTRLEPAIRILLDAGYAGCLAVEHHSARNEYEEVGYQVAEIRRVLAHLRSVGALPKAVHNPLIPAGL